MFSTDTGGRSFKNVVIHIKRTGFISADKLKYGFYWTHQWPFSVHWMMPERLLMTC